MTDLTRESLERCIEDIRRMMVERGGRLTLRPTRLLVLGTTSRLAKRVLRGGPPQPLPRGSGARGRKRSVLRYGERAL